MASRSQRMHGRVEGASARCAVAGCAEAGEYKAPALPADFDGPGAWRLLCLDHVREHNAGYNFFTGMSPEEISEAQSPLHGWERGSRVFASAGGDSPAAWSDFSDPLDAIAARFGRARGEPSSRFNRGERRALAVLGLGEDADRQAVRRRYSQLLLRYHPDKQGGDRSGEKRLGEVIDAYQLLKRSAAFG